jgi:hemerythrin
MQWSSDFEVGLPAIDVQHWHLFVLIQQIVPVDAHEEDRAAIRNVVIQLGRLARCHFDCEEWLMSTHNYPDSERHIIEHDRLAFEIEGYQDAPIFPPRKLAVILSNWLVSHTLMDDRPLALHLRTLAGSAEVPLAQSLADAFFDIAIGPNRGELCEGEPPASVSRIMGYDRFRWRRSS